MRRLFHTAWNLIFSSFRQNVKWLVFVCYILAPCALLILVIPNLIHTNKVKNVPVVSQISLVNADQIGNADIRDPNALYSLHGKVVWMWSDAVSVEAKDGTYYMCFYPEANTHLSWSDQFSNDTKLVRHESVVIAGTIQNHDNDANDLAFLNCRVHKDLHPKRYPFAPVAYGIYIVPPFEDLRDNFKGWTVDDGAAIEFVGKNVGNLLHKKSIGVPTFKITCDSKKTGVSTTGNSPYVVIGYVKDHDASWGITLSDCYGLPLPIKTQEGDNTNDVDKYFDHLVDPSSK